MMFSVNELQGALLKAGRGAGLPLGLAEDLAWAAPEIALGDTDQIVGQVLACLDGPFDPVSADLTGQGVVMSAGNPLMVIPSALDLVSAGNGPVLMECAAKELADALLASRSRIVDQGLWYDWMGPEKVILHSWKTAEFRAPEGPERVTISLDLWNGLQAWAAKTYVPESEASRIAGAGAGLTDND